MDGGRGWIADPKDDDIDSRLLDVDIQGGVLGWSGGGEAGGETYIDERDGSGIGEMQCFSERLLDGGRGEESVELFFSAPTAGEGR